MLGAETSNVVLTSRSLINIEPAPWSPQKENLVGACGRRMWSIAYIHPIGGAFKYVKTSWYKPNFLLMHSRSWPPFKRIPKISSLWNIPSTYAPDMKSCWSDWKIGARAETDEWFGKHPLSIYKKTNIHNPGSNPTTCNAMTTWWRCAAQKR